MLLGVAKNLSTLKVAVTEPGSRFRFLNRRCRNGPKWGGVDRGLSVLEQGKLIASHERIPVLRISGDRLPAHGYPDARASKCLDACDDHPDAVCQRIPLG